MSRLSAVLLTLALTLSALVPMAAGAATDPAATWGAGPGEVLYETGEPGQDRYLVLHQAAPLATYLGGVPGLAATANEATGALRLDATTPASVAYRAFLAREQDALLASIGGAIGRTPEVAFRYDAAINGFAVVLEPAEAQLVADLAGVARIERETQLTLLTDNGPAWIGADAIYDGASTPDGSQTKGEGVVVGIIDSGINTDHPSFAATGPVDGYVHTNPRGQYYGACDPVTGLPFCNDKLIGVYDFTGTSPEDDNGHGSHTASTTAGNVVSATLYAPTRDLTRTISGVAPHANVIAYKGCVTTPAIGTCPASATVASINAATLDAVDVINFSIGGTSSDPWSDTMAQAFFGATAAGVFVATSAGNDGPGAATIGRPADAPWVTSVGASTHDRKLQNAATNLVRGSDGATLADIFGKSNTAGLPANTPIVYAGSYPATVPGGVAALCGAGTAEATVSPWAPGTFNGEIVVCDRGTFGRVAKSQSVKDAGAGGFILANDLASGDSLVADGFHVPGVHISYTDGVTLKGWLSAGSGHTAAIRGTQADESAEFGDDMAGFSSRGPNPAFSGLIKPDVTAPGVDVLAAFNSPAGSTGDPAEFGLISGTSMSSPHVAGAGALIRAVHPDWTEDEVKSALMTTAFNRMPGTDGEVHVVRKEDSATATDPFDRGNGRADLRRAALAGFVLDEVHSNYSSVNPSFGGDPTTLNIASFGDGACEGTCTWTRTLRSTVDREVTYVPSADVPGVTFTFPSPTVVIPADGEVTFTVTADVSGAPANAWAFGSVDLTSEDASVAPATFAVAVFALPGGVSTPTTPLFIHGNTHDGCTGDGATDVIACDGPFLAQSDELDLAPAAEFGPVATGVDGTSARTLYDPNVVWHLPEPVVIEGRMTVDVWASCSACADGQVAQNWNVSVWADDVLAYATTVAGVPAVPSVPELVSLPANLPRIEAATELTIKIDPAFGLTTSQTGSIHYDSQLPCGAGTEPCASVIHMPVVSGGGIIITPPPPAGGQVLHLHGNVHDGCTGDGAADVSVCDGPFLNDSEVLDTAPPASWKLTGAFDGTNPRNLYDAQWRWLPNDAVVLDGLFEADLWIECGACATGTTLTFEFFADGDVAAGGLPTFTRDVDVTVTPDVATHVEFPFPNMTVGGELLVRVQPDLFSIPMTISYDSIAPCGSPTGEACDSTMTLPVVTGPNRAPVAQDDFPAAIGKGESVVVDVLVNDTDPEGDDLEITAVTQPSHGTVTLVDGVVTYTHDDGTEVADSFTYTITDGELDATATVHIRIAGGRLELTNSFVSSVGWVKPGETYPFRVIVNNPTDDVATGAAITVTPPSGATFTQLTSGAGDSVIDAAGDIQWAPGDIAPGTSVTLVAEGRAATQGEDRRIVWKDLSSQASLTYNELPGAVISSDSHGPKVIPTAGGYETARFGDRPFPVVPVDYLERKHKAHHDGASIDAKVNSPAVPGSTFNLFQEMSLGQLFPEGTVPSSDIDSADFSSYEHDWHFSVHAPAGACTGASIGTLAGTPGYDTRISDGWYQLPGNTGYYGSDKYTTAGALTPVGALFAIDDACGPTGKAVYDAAHIADPEIDYSDYDTDKDGVVDFFMMIFAGCGGNGESQKLGGFCEDPEAYDNIWPHSSSLEFYYSDPETGLQGYISDDQLRNLSDIPQCWKSDGYAAFDDCEANGGDGKDELPVYVRVGPYNVNPESAIDTASVISHEYGHSLGLPDFYSRNDRATYGDWNLMATDKGHHMDVFGKQEMGWVVPLPLQPDATVNAEDWQDSKVDIGEIHWVDGDGDPYVLSGANGDQNIHNAEAYVAKLPGRVLMDQALIDNGGSGKAVWWSGSGNDFGCPTAGGHNFDVALPELADLNPGDTVEVQFKSLWNIEWDYDYGFVMASTNGETYTSLNSLEGYSTPAANNPYANSCQAQYGNGLTGTSKSYSDNTAEVDRVLGEYPEPDGFLLDRYDLSSFVGSPTVLRFSYATDPGLAKPGWFIDDLTILVNGEPLYSSDFEGGRDETRLFNGGCKDGTGVAANCTVGWTYVDTGTGSPADHAYYLEMRDRSGFDVDGKGENDRAPIAFQPGVLLVYTDEAHGYGNTGADNQPAQTPVDSRPQPGNQTPNLNDAAFKQGDSYSDAAPGYVDNYDDGSGQWIHNFDCLAFDVTRLEGTDVNLAFNLVGDVTFTMGSQCRPFNYGLDDVENGAPTAVATAKPSTVVEGETVTLDGSGSFDDLTVSSKLTYEWDLDGDGTFDLTGQTVGHVFDAPGTYTITLRVTDGGGLTDTDTTAVTVTQATENRRPVANDDRDYTTPADTTLVVPAPGVLANDSDPDNDPLTANLLSQPSHGSVALAADGSFTYEPDAGFEGTDTFTYEASDGSLADPAVVAVKVGSGGTGGGWDFCGEAYDGDPCPYGRVHGSGHWEHEVPYKDGKTKTEKLSFSFDAENDAKKGLHGKLKANDKDADVKIDAKEILSVQSGEGYDCNGTILTGEGTFVFTARGEFEVNDHEIDGATFVGCGQDNGKKGKGEEDDDDGPGQAPDLFFVECLNGCGYDTGSRLPDDSIDGGNIHLHDAFVPSGSQGVPSNSADDADGEDAEPATAPSGSSGSSAKASGAQSEAHVVSLEPFFMMSAIAGYATPLRVDVVGVGVEGMAASLRWVTADGATGEVAGVVGASGLVTFNAPVALGAAEYTASVGGVDSNPLTIEGFDISGVTYW